MEAAIIAVRPIVARHSCYDCIDMCAEAAAKIESFPSDPPSGKRGKHAHDGGAIPELDAAPEGGAEAGAEEERAKAEEGAREAQGRKVIELRGEGKRWLDEYEHLHGQSTHTREDIERMKALHERLEKLEAMERQHDAAIKLGMLEREYADLMFQETRLTARLEKIMQHGHEARMEYEAQRSIRNVKAHEVETVAETPSNTWADDVERLRGELAQLDVDLEEPRFEAEGWAENAERVRRQLDELRKRIEDLKARIEDARKEHFLLAADVAAKPEVGMEDAVAAPERSRLRVIEGGKKASFAKRAVTGTAKFAAKAAKKTAKPAIVVGAVGTFGGLGAYALFGNFFKSWGRRLRNPHRFWDDLVHKFNAELEDPPKGKGAIMGSLSVAKWLLFGETKMSSHDTAHGEFFE